MYTLKAVTPATTRRSPDLRRAVRRALDKGADLAQRELEKPVKRWKHPVTFVQSSPDDDTRIIGTNSDIYLYNDAGTKPHVIRARRKRRLAFMWRGRMRFPVQVNHPGTKAKYLSRRAADALRGPFQTIMDRELAAALD